MQTVWQKYAYHSSTTLMTAHISSKHSQSSSKKTQSSNFTVQPRHCDTQRAERLTQLTANMIAEDTLPISFVEGKGLRALMAFCKPEYIMPCGSTMTMRLEWSYRQLAISLCKIEIFCCHEVRIWIGLCATTYFTCLLFYFKPNSPILGRYVSVVFFETAASVYLLFCLFCNKCSRSYSYIILFNLPCLLTVNWHRESDILI